MTYVAIGDSYAAGVGAGATEDGCGRTTAGYPLAVSRAVGRELRYEACPGATAVEATRIQVDAVGADTMLVTITAGGNDLGFSDVLTEVAKPAWLGDSDPVLDETQRRAESTLPGVLSPLYAAVRDRAPLARVVVLGYPRLFSGSDCNLVTFFTDDEIARMNAIADRAAEVMSEVCERSEVEFVDVRNEFAGHGTCGGKEWIHGASYPLEESFHPNAQGHEAYGRLATSALDVADPGVEGVQPAISRAAMPDRSRPIFAPPDLSSPQSRERAAAWGLDPDEVAELGRRVHPSDPAVRPDPQAAQQLWALHQQVRERRS